MLKTLASCCLLLIFATTAVADLSTSYRRLLPLEGGSNFRDMGGYTTKDGKTIVRGKLFRSGVMTSLTEEDMSYLNQFKFKTIVDLRSDEELELYPNHWAISSEIPMILGNYSIREMMAASDNKGDRPKMSELYPRILESIQPQLVRYFDAALANQVPMVVNCSAGQDRTGVTAALMLMLLGVPEETVIEDYLLSTDFRRPLTEQGDVDLAAAAKSNSFAAMMLHYHNASPNPNRPNPLVTAEGKPFLVFVFDYIRKNHGTIEAYAEQELGIDEKDIQVLRHQYLL